MSICDLNPGSTGIVTAVRAEGAIRRRLLDMGLLRNTRITVDRTAPMGGPVWIRLNGTQIALRRTEAAAILVERIVASEVRP